MHVLSDVSVRLARKRFHWSNLPVRNIPEGQQFFCHDEKAETKSAQIILQTSVPFFCQRPQDLKQDPKRKECNG